MRKNSGFTLIELLIYLAIFAIAAGLLSGILAVFVRVQSQEAAGAELTQQLSFVQSTVQRLVREAVNIENPAGTASSSLILRMTSPSLDPTIISSDSDAVYLQQGGGAVNPLTSDRVKIAQFEVVKYENPGAHAVVQLDFSLTYNSQRAYQQITRGLKTSIGRVTAATFDDSLLPNTAPNSFTIGNQTYPWNSLTLSNLLNLGQLTADPQAGQQNGSIYYNSVDNAFRGYKNLAWADLGVGWSASGNDIYNTNLGNVGIGTASPAAKLHIDQADATQDAERTALSIYRNGLGFGTYSLVTNYFSNDYLAIKTGSGDYALAIKNANGNVGIGTTSPGSTAGVTKVLEIANNANVGLVLSTLGARREIYTDSNNALYFADTSGATRVTFSNNGNVGIGTTGPAYQLQLSTDSAAKPGTNTWTVASDERIKTDVRPFTDGLDAILGINPVWYKYNGKGGFVADGKDNIGVVAQDIQKVAPYTVSSYYDKLNPADAATTELLNFNSGSLTFTTINAIKELNNKIENQRKQIEESKAENEALKKRIEIMETK